jgi:transglutaminase-like putative cysteine protease
VLIWINRSGETVFELALGGVLITYKEDEAAAKRFLSEASLNKKDMILDFSLIPTERPLPCPREAKYLEVSLEGLDDQLPVLQGPGQEGMKQEFDNHTEALYRIHRSPGIKDQQPRVEKEFSRYERPSFHIESDHSEISKIASEVTLAASTSQQKISLIAAWVSKNVEDEAVESFSALEVLHKRRGECKAHTLLYTALARAAGIPTKLVGGLVYVDDVGFLYHAWAESYDEGWVSVDPTFGQVGVDATHIKLTEGPSWSELLQLGKVIGRLKARVIDYRLSYQ